MKFATTTARDAAFGGAGEATLAEGMFAYTSDTNTLWLYDGAAWVSAINASSLNAIGTYTTYTPVLTASVTNPVLGTGSFASGNYATINKICVGAGQIYFGSSGASAGSGEYKISLPLAGEGGSNVVGSGKLRDASAGFVAYLLSFAYDGTASRMGIQWGSGNALNVTAASPITFGASDQISFNFVYRLA
jgi:hypothetical protein